MNGTTFDALAATKTLREAGFGDRQAEAVAGVMRSAVDADRGALATKADLDKLETRLTVRFFGGLFGMGGVLVAVMAGLKLFG